MKAIIQKLLLIDLLIILAGMVFLLVRPFGVDLTCGISIITIGFVLSIILFLIKLKITS